jgi:hypothetical protein
VAVEEKKLTTDHREVNFDCQLPVTSMIDIVQFSPFSCVTADYAIILIPTTERLF